MTLFAEIDGQGWALIVGALFVGVAGVLSSIGAVITGVVTLYLNWKREEAKIARDAATAKKVESVATALETNTARTETKLTEIHEYVNSYLEETQRLYAAKCRDSANDKPTPVNLAEADRAEKVYEAHRAQTEKMDRNKRAAPLVNDTGPITSRELKKDIADVPAKVADELDKRESPPE